MRPAQHQALEAMGIPRTPPLSSEEERTEKKRYRVEDSEDDEESIIKRLNSYAPLSNLPTPPISQETSPRLSIADAPVFESGSGLTQASRSLCDLIRIREKGVPALRPLKVEGMLFRSRLDRYQIAFAACVLHRLSWRFVRDWKNAMVSRGQVTGLADPEVIVLAALRVSSSWLNDRSPCVRFWVEDVTSMPIAREAFLASQFAILNDPSTSLMSIDEREVEDMVEDMRLEGLLEPR